METSYGRLKKTADVSSGLLLEGLWLNLKDNFPSAPVKQWMGKALRDGVCSVPPFLLLSPLPAAPGP